MASTHVLTDECLCYRDPQKHPLGKFSSQAVLERKNLWKAFLDTIQSADSERVQVCLCDLVKTTE
eukprot:m.996608 g.996608  ORF g.996608 m.996608 type:complete len:65 (-) comp24020_c1_seq1:804-998(-)